MADTKTLNTRISLKYGKIGDWTDSFKPLKGEVCFAEVETTKTDAAGNIISVPAVVFKVGDGVKTFGELPWASALAADVYEWAKEAGLSVDTTKAPEGQFMEGFAWEGDELVPKFRNFITEINETNKDKLDAPTTKAVKEYVDSVAEGIVAQGTVVAEGAKINMAQSGNTYTVSHEAIAQAEDGKTVTARTYVTGVTTDGYGHIIGYTTATEEDQDLSGYKTIQDAVAETGAANKTLKISQDTNGVISATPVDIAITHDQVTDFETSVKGIKVDNAASADDAAKLGGQEPAYYATAQALTDALVEAKKYADDNDANETFAISYANNTITLTGSNGTNSSFDASAFVKDSYLKEAKYDDATNVLTFTFIDNEDNLQAIPVDLTDLVDVYSADEATLTKTGSTFSVKDGGIAKAKLDSNVQASLNLADTALQTHQDISGKADKVTGATNGNFAGLDADGNLIDSGKKAADFEVAGAAAQALADAKADTTAQIEALKLGETYEPIGAENRAKAYADGLASNYDTAGAADDALKSAKAYTDELANNTVKANSDKIAALEALDYILNGDTVILDCGGAE